MPNEFKLPDLGEGVHEGRIVRLIVPEGETVHEDQPLMEVETDKAAVEIPSPYAGRIAKWHVEEGETVNVGNVMVTIDDGKLSKSPEPAKAAKKETARSAPAPAKPAAAATARTARHKPASPAVRKLARTLGVDLDAVEGTGPGGRITRTDVEGAAAAPAPATPGTPTAPAPRDAPAAPPPAARPEGEPGRDTWGEVIRAPLSLPRKTIADNMARSWREIPHVTDCDDVDVTLLDELRRAYNASDPPLGKLTLLPFAVAAVAAALRRHPIFNAQFDEAACEIVYKQYISINVGVHTERGLVAPVIRDTDMLSVSSIHRALGELAEKARRAKFAVNDLRGGTFTISNAGAMGGSRYSTPIINPPQVACLALGRTAWHPRVVDGTITPRFILPLSLSFDHRIIDGGHEITFQREIRRLLESPGSLLI